MESNLAARFSRARDPVQYLATFRTASGTMFAAERVTLGQIMLWLPDQKAVRLAAECAGISVSRSIPWPAGRSGKYGRISALRAIPELADAPLLKVPVKTAGEAILLAEALA